MLLKLPKYICIPSFTDWLTIPEVACFDTALTNQVDRSLFMCFLKERLLYNSTKTETSKNYFLWLSLRRLFISNLRFDTSKRFLDAISWFGEEFFGKVRSIEMVNFPMVTEFHLLQILASSGGLVTLNINNCTKCIKMYSLTEPVCAFNGSLVAISLFRIDKMDLSTVLRLLVCCPALVTLHVDEVGIVSPLIKKKETLSIISQMRLPLLTTFHLKASRGSQSAVMSLMVMSVINCASGITSLKLRDISARAAKPSTAILQCITKRCASCLLTLALEGMHLVDVDEQFAALDDLLTHCGSVTDLSFACSWVAEECSRDWMQSIASHCKTTLESLNLFKCNFPFYQSYKAFSDIAQCTKLSKLDIRFMFLHFDNVYLSELEADSVEFLSRLTSLSLQNPWQPINHQWHHQAFLKSCTLLRTLNLSYSVLHNEDLRLIAKYCQQLSSLELQSMVVVPNLDESFMVMVITVCTRLTHLNISSNYWVRDDTARAIMSSLSALTSLDLRGDASVSRESLLSIPLHCPKLVFLGSPVAFCLRLYCRSDFPEHIRVDFVEGPDLSANDPFYGYKGNHFFDSEDEGEESEGDEDEG